jgi:hypothetical protein
MYQLSWRVLREFDWAEDVLLHWAMQHWVLLPSRFYQRHRRAVPSRSVWQHYGAELVHVLWILCHGALLSSRFNHRHRRAMSCWDVQQCWWQHQCGLLHSLQSRTVWQHYGDERGLVLWLLCRRVLLPCRLHQRNIGTMPCWDVPDNHRRH